MAELKNYLMLFGKMPDDGPERFAHFLMIVCIVSVGQRTKRWQFGFHASLFYVQLGKSQGPSATETSPLVAASIDRNTAEPGIKRSIDVKGLQRKIDLAQYKLENIIPIGGGACVPADKTRQLILVLAHQICESQLVAVLASTDKCTIL
jgi:hypothetical protein